MQVIAFDKCIFRFTTHLRELKTGNYFPLPAALPMQIPSIDIIRGRVDFSSERINYFCAP